MTKEGWPHRIEYREMRKGGAVTPRTYAVIGCTGVCAVHPNAPSAKGSVVCSGKRVFHTGSCAEKRVLDGTDGLYEGNSFSFTFRGGECVASVSVARTKWVLWPAGVGWMRKGGGRGKKRGGRAVTQEVGG